MVSSLALILSLSIGIPVAVILGALLGYYLAMKYFKKQMRDNPPITEAQIRSMYQQMGRKPTEKQIKQIMTTFKKNTK